MLHSLLQSFSTVPEWFADLPRHRISARCHWKDLLCLIQHTADLEDLACLRIKITEDRLAIFILTECKQAANCLRSELRDTAGCVVVVGAGKKKRGGGKR